MKTKLSFLLLLTVCLSASQLAFSQDFTWVAASRDANGGIVRGSYLTNEWYDNWHIGVAGGLSTSFSEVNDPRISPMLEATVLKWFTPYVGVRLGYQGQWGKEYLTIPYTPYAINHSPLPFDHNFGEKGTLSYGMYYVHGDFMLNMSSIVFGYKSDRKWNTSLYANAGYMCMYDNKGGEGSDKEIGFGLGLYNTYKLADRWLLTADLKHTNIASRYKTDEGVRTNFFNLSVGIAYNIRRNYFRHAQVVIDENRQDILLAANDIIEKQQEEVKVLEEKVVEQKQIIDESEKIIEMNTQDLKLRAASANEVVFFGLNKSQLASTEKLHLRKYVQSQLEAQPDHVFYLTGSADKGTGSIEYNAKLSQLRAYTVRDLLTTEFGVKPENIVIKATVVADKDPEGELDRCVLIESNVYQADIKIEGQEHKTNDYALN